MAAVGYCKGPVVRERSVHIVALEHESHQSLRPSNSGSFVGAEQKIRATVKVIVGAGLYGK